MIECTECGNTVHFAGDGFATCESCDESYEPSDLTDHVIDERAAYVAAKDGDDSYELGNCGICDGHHTVARTRNDDYVCMSCFERFEYVTRCAWCNEANTGDMDGSYLSGCISCEGLIGHERD